MKTYDTQEHVVWYCRYHVVIVPKYRKKVLFGQARQKIGKIIRELARQKGIEVIEGTACPDHMHMVLSIPPKYSVSNAMGFLKGKSAIRAHLEFGHRKNLTQKSFWSRGYCVGTVGIDEAAIRKYVQEQWKRDKFVDGDQLDLHWD